MHKRVTEPHVKFHEKFLEFNSGILYHSSEFEVDMLDIASCARAHCCKLHVCCTEIAHENCHVVSQHQLWTSYFLLTKIFHCGARMTAFMCHR